MEIADQEEELSGSIVSFNGRNNTKIKSLVANIEPMQDLHGYDHQWPANGGANKWNENWEAGTINMTNGNLSSASNAIRSASFSACASNTEYYLFCGAGSSRWFLGICWYDANHQFISGSYNNRNTVTSPENAAYFKITTNTSGNIYGGTYNNNIAINYPATVITYSPYSNECPISGWTGAEIQQTGKNLTTIEAVAGNRGTQVEFDGVSCTRYTSGGRTDLYLPFKENTQYTVTLKCQSRFNGTPNSRGCLFAFFYTDGSRTVLTVSKDEITTWTEMTLTSRAGKTVQSVGIYPTEYRLYTYVDNSSFSLVEGTSAIVEPYTGNKISINWQPEAGTIHGGTVTLNEDGSADVVVTHGLKTFTGAVDEKWSNNGNPVNNVYGYRISQNYSSSIWGATESEGLSNIMTCSALAYTKVAANCIAANNSYVMISVENIMTVEDLKAWLNNNNLQLKYPMITPITYHFNNIGQLKSFLGINNIWSDTGDITVKIAEKGITAFELKPYT